MEFIQIEVQERAERGSAASAQLRRGGRIPGVLYGLKRRNLPLAVSADELERFLRTGSHLVELRMGERTRPAILREVQVDPISDAILHVDFVRVDKDHEIEDDVPVVFKGIAKGASEGGLFQGLMESVRVRCRPKDIPEEILLDVTPLRVGQAIQVKDVTTLEGVTLTNHPEEIIAQVVALRAVVEHEEEEAPGEPEVIGKVSAEEEDGESAE